MANLTGSLTRSMVAGSPSSHRLTDQGQGYPSAGVPCASGTGIGSGRNGASRANHYEMWSRFPTIWRGPLTRKHFAGGLYAAHAIAMGQFEQWEALCRWVSERPRENWSDPECMDGLLEEVMDYIHHIGPVGCRLAGRGAARSSLPDQAPEA